MSLTSGECQQLSQEARDLGISLSYGIGLTPEKDVFPWMMPLAEEA